jgi:hypothetical protein
MSKLAIIGAVALSLASAVATPAFAVVLHGARGGVVMGVGRSHRAPTSVGAFVPTGAAAAHCAQRWAYFDRASGKYMGDDGQWRPCI